MGICQKPSTSNQRAKMATRNVEIVEPRVVVRDVDLARLAQRVDLLEARFELFWQRVQQENQAAAILQQQNQPANI